ncbi:hypothetical protein Q1695_001705 [Nippostrongylus brasiliensis]|nr:hypothetical protein Q1695_001705 [Nippostrongylus brasiliensis]
MVSYVLNIVLTCTIYTSRKLRSSLIYLMFTNICFINLADLSFAILLSLINIANGMWVFDIRWCQINAAVQEFCQLYMLLTIVLIAVERAIGLTTVTYGMSQQQYGYLRWSLTKQRVLVLFLLLAIVALITSVPSAVGLLPVKPFKNRYVCAVSSGAPLAYPLARMFIYIGCLCVLLVCGCTIFKKRECHSLPLQSHEYSDFIRRNRAMQGHLSRAKLICNSIEVTRDGTTMDIPQDADTLITWLKFLFPLLSPVAILCWCSDISSCVKELVCCRSYDPPVIGQAVSGLRGAGVMPGVMTLIATADGLQLKLPNTTMNPLDLVDLPQPTAIPQQYEGVYTENERAAVPPRKEIKSIARSHLNKTGLNVSEVRHSEVHNEKGRIGPTRTTQNDR